MMPKSALYGIHIRYIYIYLKYIPPINVFDYLATTGCSSACAFVCVCVHDVVTAPTAGSARCHTVEATVRVAGAEIAVATVAVAIWHLTQAMPS